MHLRPTVYTNGFSFVSHIHKDAQLIWLAEP